MRRILAVVTLALAVVVSAPSPAQALGVDCKEAPMAAMPGMGISALLDPKPSPLPAAGDPWAASPTTSIYEQSGYAGLKWHTYDVGAVPICIDSDSTMDTTVGNATLGFAVTTVAAANGLHNRIATPSTYMAPLDKIVEKVTTALYDFLWARNGAVPPPGFIALLLVVMSLFLKSAAGNQKAVLTGAAWAVLVVVAMSGLAQYSAKASSFFDGITIDTIAMASTGAAGLSGTAITSNPAHAQGAQLVDKILYTAWVRGELGDPDSAAAKKWGPLLFKASTNSWTMAEKMKDPVQDKAITGGKAMQWKKVMDDMATQDPRAYQQAQGRTGGRAGAGFMAAATVVFTAGFRIVADLFVFAGLVMLRLLVMFAPVVAVVGVFGSSGPIGRVRNIAVASVINVAVFGVGVTVHTALISGLVGQAGTPDAMVLTLCAVATVAAFVLLRPYLTLTNVVGMTTGDTWASMKKAARTAANMTKPDLPAAAVGAAAGAAAGPAGAAAGAATAAAASAAADTFTRADQPSPEEDPLETGQPYRGGDSARRWNPNPADEALKTDYKPAKWRTA